MSDLSRILRSELTGEFPLGNPLVILGISPKVLDLGLSADDLYGYVTRVATHLVSRFHTDRKGFTLGPEVAVLRGHLSEAHAQLKDRAKYEKALDEFRRLKAEERAELRILRHALDAARQRVYSYEGRERTLTQGARQLAHDLQALEGRKRAQGRIVPDLEARLEKQARSLESRDASLRHYRRIHRGHMRYLGLLAATENLEIPHPHVFEAKWVIIASLVPAAFTTRSPKSMNGDGEWTQPFRDAAESLGISGEALEQVRKHWLARHPGLARLLPREPRYTYGLRTHILELSVGKPRVVFGWPPVIVGRVIGSIPSYPRPFRRADLITKMYEEEIVENVVPFLVRGGLLVSTVVRKLVKEPKSRRKFPAISRNTKHLILGVG